LVLGWRWVNSGWERVVAGILSGIGLSPRHGPLKAETRVRIPRWSHHHHLLGPVAGVSYRINERWSLKARYRAMAVDSQNGGFKLDAVSHGPVVGIGIHF